MVGNPQTPPSPPGQCHRGNEAPVGPLTDTANKVHLKLIPFLFLQLTRETNDRCGLPSPRKGGGQRKRPLHLSEELRESRGGSRQIDGMVAKRRGLAHACCWVHREPDTSPIPSPRPRHRYETALP
ncbi:hypothetical protein SKAU_G00134940 [Synaphobranchus kaupii]|uniref:Uncharacterized protein n=1 Tax=Synaphobranchus kaupii TaxID=118154 RepID=A0A9Q1FRB2_SYNKA|nr:hypothetical protein SKAU_G00134940 [Synaphobranchus kaupii]